MVVFTLHRYIFTELLKVFLVTTAALTIILSLGSTIAPIQRYGVAPAQIVSVLVYFMPITLTFVLPISAMFASSLVYGRLAADNEFDACRASGISLTTVIYPGLSLAILVAITTLLLSFYVVPDFVHRAERTIKDNAKQILFRNIQRKGYYEIPGDNRKYTIRADHTVPDEDLLIGVAITETRGTRVSQVITAESARIRIENRDRFNEVTVVARESYQISPDGEQSYSAQLTVAGRFESLLSDKIKFQKIAEIKKIRANMMNFNPVRELALDAGAQLGMELLAEQIARQSQEDIVDYYPLESPNKIVMVRGPRAQIRQQDNGEHTIDIPGPVSVIEMRKDLETIICTYQASSARLQLDGKTPASPLVLILENVDWQLADGTSSRAPIARRTFQYLRFPDNIQKILTPDKIMNSVRNADQMLTERPSNHLVRKRDIMNHEVGDALEEITSETHSRLVFGIGCISLVLLSITFGIQLKGSHLLSAFGVSVIPATILIVAIMAGKSLITSAAQEEQKWGIMLMWACLALLSLFTLFSYRRLMRT